ncbi:MAG: glycosyl transferase family 1 [Rhodobacterales bacterium CG_4_10_14_0_8_um_filter_70_9]|nr:MAG: glycosyl transferase family 1 [Rhodobacterales bacterium CG_4_10_14_0_8_um_filter_70_9]
MTAAQAGAADGRPIRVLFIAPHPVEGPSTRFRILQFLPYLAAHGVEAAVRPLFTSAEAAAIYGEGGLARKAALTVRAAFRRLGDARRAAGFDVVYILREAFPFGPPWLERLLAARAGAMVFDFDDAIYTPSTAYRNPLDRLRDWSKPARLIRAADAVATGSAYLAAYAARCGADPAKVSVLPTVVDADVFTPNPAARDGRHLTVGWIGTPRGSSYLRPLRPAMAAVAALRPDARFVFVGAEPFDCGGVNVAFPGWRLEREVADVQSFDIGLMPLPDDEEARGKCGFKLIEYMATGAAVVCSPVGANRDIVENGRTGLFATTPQDWSAALSRLAADAALRDRLGRAGRARVAQAYCLDVVAPQMLALLRRVAARGQGVTS